VCGIAGLYSPAGTPNPELVDAMRAAIVHRGPDDGSTDVFGHCVLGHQRLKVIDLDTGYQPVSNEAGDIVAVFNGEAYNFAALRAELRGHEVRGTGDTPVLPHLYEENGPRFVERMHGMFALALWDAPRERLVLARDRLGKKPLLWTRLADGTFAFASELKALLRLPGLPRDVDLAAIDAYLALQYVPGDGTALRGIRKVPPGHVLVVEGEHERLERRRRGAEAARRRRAARGAALRGNRLEHRRRTDGTGVRRARADVHGGLLGCALRRAHTCARGRRALRHRARGAGDRRRRCGNPAAIGRRVRRAARRRGCVPDVPDRGAGAPASHGCSGR
jgi:asparagine synthase (glutamine-hydrolysing)